MATVSEAGRFDMRVTIEENTPTRAASGAIVDSWSDFSIRWACRRTSTAREIRAGKMVLPELETQFIIRGPLAVTNNMRVRQGALIFDILGVETTDGKEPEYSRELVLNCRSGKGTGS